jgi:AraC family transcriptional regulator
MRHKDKNRDQTAKRKDTRIILIGAEDPLPSQHFWFEGRGYWIYAAEQPRSAWREHTHDCAQVTIGLEPAHVHAEWRTGSRLPGRREISGNAVSVIPSGEPHRTLWQRRASLIHIYISDDFLSRIAHQLLHEASFDLRTAYLVRDPFIEELGRVLYRECQTEKLCVPFANSLVEVLVAHLLRSYNDNLKLLTDLSMGLGPARERRVCEYIEKSLEHDLSIEALAKIAGLSTHYFADMFHQSTGFTPHQYVCRRRVERAQHLLRNPKLSLIEVGYRCGFTSQSQFTTVFRRFTGSTPGKFRTE